MPSGRRSASGRPGRGEQPGDEGGRPAPGAATLAARAARDARLARQARRTDAARAARGSKLVGAGAAGWRWGLAAIAAGLVLAGGAAFWLWPRATAELPKAPAPGLPPPVAAKAAPLPVLSMAELLASQTTGWRLVRLREYPAVLAIEFPDLAEQGAAMNRIAALLEKAGAPRDRVLGDVELAALITRSGDNSQTFYQGHDYDGPGLARFFTRAEAQRLKLNAGEERLRRELLSVGLLQSGAGGMKAGSGDLQALITFTSTQADDPATPVDETVDAVRRESVLRHEASHGRYYTQPSYREHSRRFWTEAYTDAQRERFRAFLAGAGYNRADEDLMINEAQAFLLHTPDARAFTAASIGLSAAELEALRSRFWRTLPAEAGALSPAASAASR
jgi:hypothetical protein